MNVAFTQEKDAHPFVGTRFPSRPAVGRGTQTAMRLGTMDAGPRRKMSTTPPNRLTSENVAQSRQGWRLRDHVWHAALCLIGLVILVAALNQLETRVRNSHLDKYLDKLSPLDLAALLESVDVDQSIKIKSVERLAKEKVLSPYVFEKLFAAAKSGEPKLQFEALQCLATHWRGILDPSAICPLLQSKDEYVRIGAILVLLNFEAHEQEAFTAFEGFLDNKEFLSRAIDETSKHSQAGQKLAKYYVQICEQGNDWDAGQAAYALRRVGADKKKSTAVIAKLLDRSRSGTRCYALQCLGGYGRDAAWLLPRIRSIADEDADCRVFALQTINQIQGTR
jgi:hypothetical protein